MRTQQRFTLRNADEVTGREIWLVQMDFDVTTNLVACGVFTELLPPSKPEEKEKVFKKKQLKAIMESKFYYQTIWLLIALTIFFSKQPQNLALTRIQTSIRAIAKLTSQIRQKTIPPKRCSHTKMHPLLREENKNVEDVKRELDFRIISKFNRDQVIFI